MLTMPLTDLAAMSPYLAELAPYKGFQPTYFSTVAIELLLGVRDTQGTAWIDVKCLDAGEPPCYLLENGL